MRISRRARQTHSKVAAAPQCGSEVGRGPRRGDPTGAERAGGERQRGQPVLQPHLPPSELLLGEAQRRSQLRLLRRPVAPRPLGPSTAPRRQRRIQCQDGALHVDKFLHVQPHRLLRIHHNVLFVGP